MDSNSIENTIDILMIRWQEAWDRGEDIPAEILCSQHPERLSVVSQQIASLKKLSPKLDFVELSQGSSADDSSSSQPSRNTVTCHVNYQNLSLHAKGGLGEIYKAVGDDFNRKVAIKFMKHKHKTQDDVRRFLREAKVTGILEHPGVVPVYGVGLDEHGVPHYAMRFVNGKTLTLSIAAFHSSEIANRDPTERALSFNQLLQRFISVCNTIAFAHNEGFLHRDIKPSNVMVGEFNETLVVDWGLAKRFVPSKENASPGEETIAINIRGEIANKSFNVVGTLQYISPEHINDAEYEAVPSSDIYSLGVMFYVLLTGSSPFDGRTTTEVLAQIRRGQIIPLASAKPGTPKELAAICKKAMAIDPRDRYTTALELASDIQRWQADERVSAFRESVLARVGRWMRKHRTAVRAAIVALLSIVGVLTIALIFVNAARHEEVVQRKRADANALAERLNLYASHMNRSDAYLRSGQIRGTTLLLNRQVPATGEQDLRGFEWYYLRNIIQRAREQKIDVTNGASAVAYSPDGKTLAIGTRGGIGTRLGDYSLVNQSPTSDAPATVQLWDVATRKLKSMFAWPVGPVNSLSFFPDGGALLVAGGERNLNGPRPGGIAAILDVKSGAKRTGFDNSDVVLAALTPDGHSVVTWGNDQKIHVWDTGTGRLKKSIPANYLGAMSISRDGSSLATVSLAGAIAVVDLAGEGSSEAINSNVVNFKTSLGGHAIQFSPDQKSLAAGFDDGHVEIWDVASKTVRMVVAFHVGSIQGLVYTRDGKSLLSGSTDATIRAFDVTTGVERLTYKGHLSPVLSIVASPDGRGFVTGSADQSVLFWEFDRTNAESIMIRTNSFVQSLSFLPNGEIASGGGLTSSQAKTGYPGEVEIWNPSTAVVTHSLQKRNGPIQGLASLRGGKEVVVAGTDVSRSNSFIQIRDVSTGRLTKQIENSAGSFAAVAACGELVATSIIDQSRLKDPAKVKIWNASQGVQIGTTFENPLAVTSLAISAKASVVAIGGFDGTTRLWNYSNNKVVIIPARTGIVNALSLANDGKTLAVAHCDISSFQRGSLTLWNIEDLSKPLLALNSQNGWISTAFCPDSSLVAAGGSDGFVNIYKLADLSVAPLRFKTGPGWSTALAFSPDGKVLAVGNSEVTGNGGGLNTWDVSTGRSLGRPGEVAGKVESLAFDDTGQTLVGGAGTGELTLWTLDQKGKKTQWQGASSQVQKTHEAAVLSTAASSDGRWLATGSEDGSILIWDLASHKLVISLDGDGRPVTALAFSPNNQTLASGSGGVFDRRESGEALLWNVSSWKPTTIPIPFPEGVGAIAFSPDGIDLAIGSSETSKEAVGGIIVIVKLDTLRETLRLNAKSESFAKVTSVSYPHDSRRIAAAGLSNVAVIWEFEKKEQPVILRTSVGLTNVVAFAPDGRTVVTAGNGPQIQFWQAANGEELIRLDCSVRSIRALTFNRDGSQLSVGGQDEFGLSGSIQIWSAPRS